MFRLFVLVLLVAKVSAELGCLRCLRSGFRKILLHIVQVVLGVRILIDIVDVILRAFHASVCFHCESRPEEACVDCASDHMKNQTVCCGTCTSQHFSTARNVSQDWLRHQSWARNTKALVCRSTCTHTICIGLILSSSQQS